VRLRKPSKEQKARPSMMPSALAVFGLMAGPMRSGLMSLLGHQRTWRPRNSTSAVPPKADSSRTSGHVRLVPIVLKKSFLTNERKFLGPLMRFVRGDVRDHIVTPKIDHGSS
jgi:hypothetical protein